MKPEEVKDEKPEEVKDEKPEEVKDEKPEEVKDEKPEELKDEKPEEVKDEKPEEVKDEKPEEVKDEKPEEVKDVKPEEVKDEKPEEVKDEKPEEVEDGKPEEVKDEMPEEVKVENVDETEAGSVSEIATKDKDKDELPLSLASPEEKSDEIAADDKSEEASTESTQKTASGKKETEKNEKGLTGEVIAVEKTPKPAKKKPGEKLTEEEILNFEVPLEEFDWASADTSGFGEEYSKDDKSKMEDEYLQTLNTITEKEVVKGVVVAVNPRDIILNIGFKSDGMVSSTEFKDLPDLKVGDEVEVYIEEQENINGQLVLSRRKAKIVKAWENIQNALDNDEIIEGVVKRRTKGGLIVDIFSVEAFLPGSQIDVKPIRDFDVFVDKTMEVKVVKINYANDNVVVSHKVLIEKDLEEQKAQILNNLEKGQILEGVIKNMTNFGVFIDLGGVDGLLHITDISWGRINHPEDVLNLDDSLKVVVLDFDEDKKRISLGMKQLTPHPWDSLSQDIEVGSKVKGKIVNVADYGAFLEISTGVEGLIHVSEMSWSQHLRNPSDFLNVGDKLEAIVLTLDREERKMSLGIKQLSKDPWTKADLHTKYAIGTTHKGIVRNLTNFGLFIELEEGIDGLVHVSDLSWTKKVKHPSEFISVGDELEVKVLELDAENRRLALGHKQLEDNPWDTFADVFTIGSVHKCTVINKFDRGAILELPYGIEGFANNRQLVKEDGSTVGESETLDFKVLEFSKDDKRIVLSHTATYKDEKPRPPKKKKKSHAIDMINQNSKKDTLGDIEVLTTLKEQMESGTRAKPVSLMETKPKPKAEAKKKEEVKTEKPKATKVVEEAEKEVKPKAKTAKAKAKKETTKADAGPEAATETESSEKGEAKAKSTGKKQTTPKDKAAAKADPKAETKVKAKAKKALKTEGDTEKKK